MSDENKNDQSSVTTITRNETREVIVPPSEGAANLEAIFNGMAAGKSNEQAIADAKPKSEEARSEPVVAEKPVETAPPEEKPVIVAETPKDTSLEAAIENERKPKEAKEEAPKSEEAKPDDFSDIPKEELGVLPHDKPKTARRIKALLRKIEEETNVATTTKKQLEEKNARLTELEGQLKGTAPTGNAELNDDVKKQLDELAMYRRQHQIESDPVIKERFDSVAEAKEKEIETLLKANQAGDWLIQAIKDEGGWAKLGRSNKTFKIAGSSKPITGKELFMLVRDTLIKDSPTDAMAIDSAMQDQIRLNGEKARFVETERSKAKEYFETQTKQQQKYREEGKAKVEKWVADTFQKEEIFHELPVPENASATEKANIIEENKYRAQLKDELKATLADKPFDELLQIALNSVKLFPAQRKLATVEKTISELRVENKKLQDELTKVRSAGSTVPKRGQVVAGGNGSSPSPKLKGPPTLEEALELASRGQLSKDGRVLVERE